KTKQFMQAASRRSLHESIAVYWMMRNSTEHGDYKAAIRYADTLLRIDPHVARYVMPILGRIAEIESARGELRQVLAASAPWRPTFFSLLPENVSDARTPLAVLLSLNDTAAPPAAADLNSYLNFLISRGYYELAYYTWLQFLPA